MADLFGIITAYQSAALWQNLFDLAEQRRRELEHGGDENAETLRQAVLVETRKILTIKDHCREHAPSVLPLVPNVNPFDAEHEYDCYALADRMVEVEAALLEPEKTVEKGGKSKRTRAPNGPNAKKTAAHFIALVSMLSGDDATAATTRWTADEIRQAMVDNLGLNVPPTVRTIQRMLVKEGYRAPKTAKPVSGDRDGTHWDDPDDPRRRQVRN